MVDLKDLRENPDRYREAAKLKRIDVDIDRLLSLDEKRRGLDARRQQVTAEKNAIGKQIGALAGKAKKAPTAEQAALTEEMSRLQSRAAELKTQEAALEAEVAQLSPQIDDLLYRAQPADPEVPVGKDDSENVEVSKWGAIPEFDFTPKDHIALGRALGLIDIERGVKLAGSRNYFLTGDGSLRHQAVLRLAQDMMIERDFVPMTVPVLVREQAMLGTGCFPLGREQSYAMSNEDPPKFLCRARACRFNLPAGSQAFAGISGQESRCSTPNEARAGA